MGYNEEHGLLEKAKQRASSLANTLRELSSRAADSNRKQHRELENLAHRANELEQELCSTKLELTDEEIRRAEANALDLPTGTPYYNMEDNPFW